MLLVVLTLPFHAFLGVTIMDSTRLIGGDWYPALREGPMGAWLPDAWPTTSTSPAGSCGAPATWWASRSSRCCSPSGCAPR